MTKFVLALILAIPIALAAASQIDKDELNSVLFSITSQFHDVNTNVDIEFEKLSFSGLGVKDVAVRALLWKSGPANTLDFKIPTLVYTNPGNRNPQFKVEASLNLDMLTAFGADTLNETSKELDKMAVDFVKEQTDDFGAAIDARASVHSKKFDKDGNITNVVLDIEMTLDPSKLPANVKLEDALFLSTKAQFAANLKGASGKLTGTINPKYKGFDKDLDGLKEELQMIVDRDEDALDEFSGIITFLVGIADEVVNIKRN